MKRAALIVLILVAAMTTLAPRQAARAAACRPALTRITVSPAAAPGGASSKVAVTLSCRAPAAVTIHLSAFTGVTVPRALDVRRGKQGATATIRTSVRASTKHGEIEAALGRTHRKAVLTVTRTPPSCQTPRLTGFTAPSLMYAGTPAAATIRLSCAPTAPIRLSLKSANPDLPVPAAVTIGRYYDYAIVPLDPRADEAGRYSARLTVRYKSTALARSATVDPGMSLFSIPPCSEPNCVQPEVLFTGIVPAGGLTVRLTSSNPAIVVPATFTAAAGSLGGNFNVTVQPVTKNTTVTLTAAFGGRKLRATTVLLPPFGPGDTVSLSARPARARSTARNLTWSTSCC